jgi:hypothetical protein
MHPPAASAEMAHAPIIFCRSSLAPVRHGKPPRADIGRNDEMEESEPEEGSVECRKERRELGQAQRLRDEFF